MKEVVLCDHWEREHHCKWSQMAHMLYRDDFDWIKELVWEALSLLFTSLWSEGQIFRWKDYMHDSHNTKNKYNYWAAVLSMWQIVNLFRCPFYLFEESFKRISLNCIHSDRKCSSAIIYSFVNCTLLSRLCVYVNGWHL